MKRKVWLAVLLCSIEMLFCACGTDVPQASEAKIQINPLAESVSHEETMARLYYGFGESQFLAGENRRIKVPANESIETSVLNELIVEGPALTTTNLKRVINPETTVVSTRAEGQFLAVTLSNDFLEPPESINTTEAISSQAERTRRQLAVYSIVNTLVEQGSYSRVRILIDADGNGGGRPLRLQEAGLSGTGECEPFARNGDIELTALNTMRELMRAVEQRDWSLVYDFIAYKNQYGQDKPSIEDFVGEMEQARLTVSSSVVIDDVLAPDGVSEIIMVSYDIKPGGGEVQSFQNVPQRLVLENDIWKMTYNAFDRMYLDWQ